MGHRLLDSKESKCIITGQEKCNTQNKSMNMFEHFGLPDGNSSLNFRN